MIILKQRYLWFLKGSGGQNQTTVLVEIFGGRETSDT